MFLKLLPFFGQKWPFDGGASFLALFFQEISRKGARFGNIREKTGEDVLFERYFQKISKNGARFGKILENTKKVAGGRGGVKGAAELRAQRAWRS